MKTKETWTAEDQKRFERTCGMTMMIPATEYSEETTLPCDNEAVHPVRTEAVDPRDGKRKVGTMHLCGIHYAEMCEQFAKNAERDAQSEENSDDYDDAQ